MAVVIPNRSLARPTCRQVAGGEESGELPAVPVNAADVVPQLLREILAELQRQRESAADLDRVRIGLPAIAEWFGEDVSWVRRHWRSLALIGGFRKVGEVQFHPRSYLAGFSQK